MAGSNDLSEKLNTGKDFASEYRKSVEIEIPDLWDRINAGIDAKENEKKKAAQSEPVAEIKEFKAAKKTRKNPSVYIMPAVAAVICIGVMIPLFMKGGLKNASTTNSAEECAGCAAARPETEGEAEDTLNEDAQTENAFAFFGVDSTNQTKSSDRTYAAAGEKLTLGKDSWETGSTAVVNSDPDKASGSGELVEDDDVEAVDNVNPLGKLIYEDEKSEEVESAFSDRIIISISVKEGTTADDVIRFAEKSPEHVKYCFTKFGGYTLVFDTALDDEKPEEFCERLVKENDFITKAVPGENMEK